MNDCERYIELISSLIDGEATPDEMSEAMAHMESCPDCRDFYETMLAAQELTAEPVEAPDGLVEGAMAKITGGEKRKADARRRTRKRVVRILSAAACFAVVILAASRLPALLGKESSDSAAPEAPALYSMKEASPADSAPAEAREESVNAFGAESESATDGAAPMSAEQADAAPSSDSTSAAVYIEEDYSMEDAGYAAAVTDTLEHLRTESPDSYAYVFLYGELPDGFLGGNMTEVSEGVYRCEITPEYADELASEGYTAYYGSGDGDAVAVLIVR